jgi:hypothetical protein
MDYLDGDQIVKYLANIYGVNHKLIKDTIDVEKQREQQQQQAQQQEQLQDQNTQADTVNKLGAGQGV